MGFTLDQLAIFAVRADNLPLLKERIESGAAIDYHDPDHGSILGEAIRKNNIEILDWLIDNGVDVNVEYRDAVGPLEIALHSPNPEVVYRLTCAGAKLKRKARPHLRKRLEECLREVSQSLSNK